ncbi:RNA polymerase subunit sigma-70 [Actinocrispum wychmicini]|uniref:RNA polymerase sigma-70 factor (ECF subfamily) n=1 Tax=Actinocrispum wychmicini TaxID=1213861 RepID=A0A4R2JUH2_9PSEU|nr:RNA polymerase subunit sigma-70 [Actinocrispum wychmicini]TCO62692.1 RNA polymerase sigma-70 factor (ECF subfamily) [Actinocrispum wychmicini]
MTAPDLEPHRRELHVHCYRMLASFHEAEDAVQETFVRALRGWDGFEKGAFRAWLYRIATNVCLDMIRRDGRQVTTLTSFTEVPWLQPFPDRMLPRDEEPDSVAVRRETIELAFVAAMQVLPARQRAAFVARDVLGWSAKETAAMLEISVAAANSAVQRARATMQERLPANRSEWSTSELSDEEQGVLAAFIDAHERFDVPAMVSIAARDLRITMPPNGIRWQGLAEIEPKLRRAFVDQPDGDWRLVPTMANRMPTAASYLRQPGDTLFRIFKFDVLRVEHGRIAEITTFGPAAVIAAFDLPRILE